ncbi:hypothetical protein BJ912DRAFT_921550 [Pholiota molesta]|nr:hypothetical protein BJ912DRAFT_921550 [Pholiota molesta]
MNFLDSYDIAPRAPTPNPADAPSSAPPSLNEEVNEVIGQLGRFWGGFRKQSQTALQAARKDFGEVVVQAQKEIAKYTAPEETAEGSGSGETLKAAEGSADAAAATAGSSSTSDDPTSSSADLVPDSTTVNTPQDTTRDTANTTHFTAPTSLFARLQSALPPTIVASSNLQTNLANVQTTLTQTDLTALRAQAEELALRSEARLRDVVREAGDVLRDADADGAAGAGGGMELLGSTPGLAWDGADMWMLPGEGSSRRASTEGSRRASSASGSGAETQTSVATRAEALLRRLAREPAIVRHDPEAEEGVRERYYAWRAEEGGLESAEWAARIEKAREDPVDGAAVKQLEESLVPFEMTKDDFWLRFFFRTYQIKAEEEKRKALLQSTADTDEDFSWEDEDEDEDAPTTTSKVPTQTLDVPVQNTGQSSSRPGRVGSSDSFDLVSASQSVAGDAPAGPVEAVAEKKSAETEEDGDSDWE